MFNSPEAAGAPRIDTVSGDLYRWLVESCAICARSGNPMFIPETLGGQEGSMRALCAFGRHEYFLAGRGVSVTFSPNAPGPALAGLGAVEEGGFANDRSVAGR